jgi:TetR/AcrR family transcriptional regulator, cholesterol catabolism regulator
VSALARPTPDEDGHHGQRGRMPIAENETLIRLEDRPSLLARSFVARAAAPARPSGKPSPRRDEIVAAAKQLFATNGYDATSIKEIADAVGLLKGSLYYHVSSKEEILGSIVHGFLGACEGVLDHVRATGGSPRPTLRRFVASRRALHTFDWRGSAILAALPEPLRRSHLAGALSRAEAGDRRFLEDLLASGAASGALRLRDDPARVAGFVLDLVAAPGIRHAASGEAIDRDASSCADFVLAALAGGSRRAA